MIYFCHARNAFSHFLNKASRETLMDRGKVRLLHTQFVIDSMQSGTLWNVGQI